MKFYIGKKGFAYKKNGGVKMLLPDSQGYYETADKNEIAFLQKKGYEPADAEAQEPETETALSDMPYHDLQKMAKSLGIDVPRGVKKDELIELIEQRTAEDDTDATND